MENLITLSAKQPVGTHPPEIAAALREAKLEQLPDRIVKMELALRRGDNYATAAWRTPYPENVAFYADMAMAEKLAAGVFAAQVAASA